mmetsp:Transcript_19991/g.27773  ORF Transcript_19991/g.27773 Transcript_19991/m.27773 type:complete len:193 (+) Transcript_19991:272-850(+)
MMNMSIIHRFLLFWGMALVLVASSTTTTTTNAFTPISVSSRTSTRSSRLSASTLAQPQPQQHQQQQLHKNTIVMMPAVIEKEKTSRQSGNSITIERPEQRVTDPSKERQSNGSQGWEVRIYNDGINTREYVARSLVQITGMSEMAAYQTMMTAHQNGLAVVGRWVYEVAEMYHDALRKSGIVCDLVPVEEDN